MKFSEKYPDVTPGKVTDPDTLLVSSEEKPCCVCGEMTKFIDYCGECYLCSEECSTKLWSGIAKNCKATEGEE